MDLVKIRKNENKTEYCIDTQIDKVIDLSYTDIVNISNTVAKNEIFRQYFKVEIETKAGEYSFSNLEQLNEGEYNNFVNEGIEKIRLYVSAYHSKDPQEYLNFTMYIYKDNYASVNIKTLDEIFARGLCGQIISYFTNSETWYSGIFKAVKRFELVSLFIVIFISNLISSLHSMGIRYRYIIFLLGINIFVILVGFIEKFSFIHKTNFVLQKKKSSIFAYFKNPRFWQHVINTIVTVVLTTLANIYFLKH